MFYDKMREPPPYGSLQEVLCLIIWRHKQALMVASVRAQAQAAVGGDAAVEAFQEFKKTLNRVEVEDREKKLKTALNEWSKIPEIRFQPQATTTTLPTFAAQQPDPQSDGKDAIKRALASPRKIAPTRKK